MLKVAYESITQALWHAAELLQHTPRSEAMFHDLANDLCQHIRAADDAYRNAEVLLLASNEDSGSLQNALSTARNIQDRCGHVILGSVPYDQARNYLRTVPQFNLREMLLLMRSQVCQIAFSSNLRRQGTQTNSDSPTQESSPHSDVTTRPNTKPEPQAGNGTAMRRGQRPKTYPHDVKIVAAWETGQCRTKKDLAETLGHNLKLVEAAIERARSRRRRCADK